MKAAIALATIFAGLGSASVLVGEEMDNGPHKNGYPANHDQYHKGAPPSPPHRDDHHQDPHHHHDTQYPKCGPGERLEPNIVSSDHTF